jgi:hypothetical protein
VERWRGGTSLRDRRRNSRRIFLPSDADQLTQKFIITVSYKRLKLGGGQAYGRSSD